MQTQRVLLQQQAGVFVPVATPAPAAAPAAATAIATAAPSSFASTTTAIPANWNRAPPRLPSLPVPVTAGRPALPACLTSISVSTSSSGGHLPALALTQLPSQTMQHSTSIGAAAGLRPAATVGGMARVARVAAAAAVGVSSVLQQPPLPVATAVPSDKYTAMLQTMRVIAREEGGVRNLWRGNFTNILRVGPYSAAQFAFYDFAKSKLTAGRGGSHGRMSIPERLGCGAAAGVVATALTYPLDVIRLRQTVDPSLSGLRAATAQVWRDGGWGPRGMFKGFGATMWSLTPFIAINFAAFDGMKAALARRAMDQHVAAAAAAGLHPSIGGPAAPGPLVVLSLGAASGLLAQTLCYPLDTIRRRMQLRGTVYPSVGAAFSAIVAREGPRALYSGMAANATKVVPLAAIRFMCYELFKGWLGIAPNATKAAAL